MSSTPELDREQLAAARASAWKQTGEPLLTLEAARDWVNRQGLVLFGPRPQLAAPAPSLVEATLGEPNAAPSLAQTEVARSLAARLVSEGQALPLNLLGTPGDSPDFLVGAQVFSYVFTMRGDKLWKQPPSTSGAVRVSPLGLRVYEVLTERGALTAAELAAELGREVTETAIVRALGELWAQLRVIPLLGQGGESNGEGSTLWELTARRFTRAIKAGANAGQPTALSALVSLYLAQVFAATEEETATFLSPLTARSRVREVLHALLGARQLDTVAVEGRTLLHIPGTLPKPIQVATAAEGEPGEAGERIASAEVERPKKLGTGRIHSFTGDRGKSGEYRGKPARSFGSGGGRREASASRGPGSYRARAEGSAGYRPRAGATGERQRRPFTKNAAPNERPDFTKPWDEEKRRARPAESGDSFAKFRRPAPEERKPLGPREQAGLPPERRRPSPRRDDRAGAERAGSAGRFRKRPYGERPAESGGRSAAKRPNRPHMAEDRDHARDQRSSAGGARPDGMRDKRPARPAKAGARPFTRTGWTPKREGEARQESRNSGPGKRPFRPRGDSSSGGAGAESRERFSGPSAGRFGGKPAGPNPGKNAADRPPRFGLRPDRKSGGKPRGFGSGNRGGAGRGTRPDAARRPRPEDEA